MDESNTWKIRKTVLEMLEDRKFKVDKAKSVTKDEFLAMYEEKNYDIMDDDKKVYVYFYKESKSFSKKDLETTVQQIKDDQGDPNIHIILILRENPNITIKNELSNPLYRNVEYFLDQVLTSNKMKHELQPKFVLLSDEEQKIILNRYTKHKRKFAKILSTDPIAKYYGLKSGNIIRIERNSTASGIFITYKLIK